MSGDHGSSIFGGLRGSIIIAAVLLLMDGVFYGCFLLSFFIGPIWLLFAIVKAVIRRNKWLLSIKRILIPLVTLGVVFGNAWLQARTAHANAELIIHACTQYQIDKGQYPKTLGDLVPEYLHSVPRAKYALSFGGYDYFCNKYDGQLPLMWVELPTIRSSVLRF